MAGQTRQPAPVARHRMSSTGFTALGSGQGSESAVAVLKAAQLSRARVKLARIARILQGEPSWALIQEFDTTDRDLLNRVLTDPFLMPANGTGARGPGGTLARIALSCAALSKGSSEVDLFVNEDVLSLPQVGTLPVPAGLIHITVKEASGITVNGTEAKAVRHDVRLGPVRVRIEDRDPARDRFGHPVTGPLSPAELDAWRGGLDDAAVVLAKRHPEALAEMAECLTTIVPLQPQAGRQRSATARSAFGALGIALPETPPSETGEALACLLLHEFQHLKLGAVLDMFRLFDKTDTTGYTVAWRPGLRPLEAVLQGVYAHITVVEYWRRRALATHSADSDGYSHRAENLANQVREALTQITASPGLAPLGRQWVTDMAATAAEWR